MRYQPISAEFYRERREQFKKYLSEKSLAFLCSNDVKHTNADDVLTFVQNSDLFYLSGIDQPETLLVVFPEASKEADREILFIKKVDEHHKIWDGDLLMKEQAKELSGVSRVEWLDQFEKIMDLITFEASTIYLPHNEHKKRATRNQQTQADRWIQWFNERYPLHQRGRVASITRLIRPIKSGVEVEQIQRAVDIGTAAFEGMLRKVRPGMKEYELEAELTYVLMKNGASRHAFLPIVASGSNACVLHYNSNDRVCKDGDMVLLDFGVCYGNYHSDTTRCFPVNGTFSDRQKAVYESVLYCLKEGSKWLKSGVAHADYEQNMASLVEHELVKLGLITEEEIAIQDPDTPAYKKYFMHGTAHHLGLDVHDVGSYQRDFEPGMVLTCEPGIYIPEEGIGCRLENDYLITEDGNINLSSAMPIEIEEIEAIMQSSAVTS